MKFVIAAHFSRMQCFRITISQESFSNHAMQSRGSGGPLGCVIYTGYGNAETAKSFIVNRLNMTVISIVLFIFIIV